MHSDTGCGNRPARRPPNGPAGRRPRHGPVHQGDRHAVQAVGSTGRACAPKGEDPPKGYVRYPEGKVPKTVDDTWERYWNTHVIDENGTVRKAEEGE
ncbi:SCO0607 family lipoprotein [Streptomyces shenzhenensis]|uniref:SCO0607 family lipoprotein n=1 Tax=Streptomyces shenzhenensis TaxID=943815 RepID=UPI003F53EB91